jgi:hypothetical protein
MSKELGATPRRSALVATYNFGDGSISFCELPVIQTNDGPKILDGRELLHVAELDIDENGCDAAVRILAVGEVVTPELKAELEKRLRSRMAQFNIR